MKVEIYGSDVIKEPEPLRLQLNQNSDGTVTVNVIKAIAEKLITR